MSATKSSNLNDRKGTDDGNPSFSYFEGLVTGTADFVNSDTALFVLVIGLPLAILAISSGSSGSNQTYFVRNAGGQTIDALGVTQNSFGSPTTGATVTFTGLIKKLLIPPGGALHTNVAGNTFFQAIKGSLKELIERGLI